MAPDPLDPSDISETGVNASRRGLLLGAAAALSSSPGFAQTIARALAVPAQRLSGGLGDIEHVVFLMQENRSFDHYFGSLGGVRGFSDPRAVPLPSGKPVWQQPSSAAVGTADVTPYHFDVRNTNALRVGLDHSWKGSQAAWKDWNAWVPRKGARCMGFFNRQDLPFYYALADAFTVCDAYHCSIFGPTDPNRFYALSGHCGGVVTGIGDSRLYNVTGGIYNADIANDNSAASGISWPSYAEQLDGLGVSWKVYQEWDNYGDNYLQYFRRYRVDASGAKLTPASPLYQRARAMAAGSGPGGVGSTSGQYLIDAFAKDAREGRLPAVSWICAPTEYCEHPEQTPNAGEHFTARLLAALVDQPQVWAKTLLVLTYDENDGFFDHMPAPVPPLSSAQGRSTVSTAGETYGSEPIGLGPRVPMLLISPFTKGGRVNSQLADHTSLIRLLEEWLVQGRGLPRERVQCPHISPWRRAVCGDLLSALQLGTADARWPASVPLSASYPRTWGTRDALPPALQPLPAQEVVPGSPRPACPLPYRSVVTGAVQGDARQFALSFANLGSVGASFIVQSQLRSDGPWHYTVEAGKRVDAEVWNWSGPAYHLRVQGANGYLREFAGALGAGTARADFSLEEDPANAGVRLRLTNAGSQPIRLTLKDLAYGDAAVLTVDLAPSQSREFSRPLSNSRGWYDLGLTVEGDARFWRRFAGHLEGAGLDFSDPVLNGQALAQPSPSLPGLPAAARFGTSALQCRVGESVTLNWVNLPAGDKHWIGVYRKGDTPGSTSSLKWNYVSAPAGSQALGGLPAGDYLLGLFLNDGYVQAAPALALSVK